ncbi:MAG: cation-translocating P-type ATPase [Candidatus Uhrbacteria bacterium]|nr:cation-translocating P-type ATPase [Candidatus Uhrbacteria bacterium]
MKDFFQAPKREYGIIASIGILFVVAYFFNSAAYSALWVVAIIGSIPVVLESLVSIRRRTIGIDTFNLFALVVSFFTTDVKSASFIVLMFSFARLLEWRTSTRTHDAVAELLRLKPLIAVREKNGIQEEIHVEDISQGDTLIVKNGSRLPSDGVIVSGSAYINEASVTGESVPVEKTVGDSVMSATLNESGLIKVRATQVGKNSTIERMAELIRQAALHKSKNEKLADKFAGVFLPFVIVLGVITYAVTRNIQMTAALFLVACADDMAVAIPLAVTAAIGQAAKRGVIIKGGQWLDALGRVRAVILDKTGTLTYGTFAVRAVWKDDSFSDEAFWIAVGMAEKYSEHPIGRALFRHAREVCPSIPDPDETHVTRGVGIDVRHGDTVVCVGNDGILSRVSQAVAGEIKARLAREVERYQSTTSIVLIDGKLAGIISVSDIPRPEAADSIARLKRMGVGVTMFTGDNEVIAKEVAGQLNIEDYRARMKPEDKLEQLALISSEKKVAMIGDGINDAPALARADVGIAMGGGTSVSVESADIIILNDDLSRIPEMILLGRRTTSVITADIAIWLVSNCIGFALVFAGIATPAVAAFYNFITDFIPLINSSRLFASKAR